MRPIRLEVQGLTSYREPISVDFSELDLFAITGPTGAGKSSLVDAITYALYGQVPRVGRNVKELISQSAERLKVSFYFSVGEGKYRIHRETGRRSTKPPQLERFHSAEDEWRPEDVDRVKDTNRFIEDLLRMDYEAFIRSVLLPQGEFQEFLAGDRDQRRKVLDGLLRLGVYNLMQQRANGLAIKHGEDADRIRQRLVTELRDATPETLAMARAEVEGLKRLAEEETAAREALDAATRLAETLADARKREREAAAALTLAEDKLAKAKELTKTGEKALANLDERIAGIGKRVAALEYDADVHLKLTRAQSVVAECRRANDTLAARVKELRQQQPAIMSLRAEAAAANEALARAEAEANVKRDAFDEAQRTNAAVLLRRDLKAGDMCPVCTQKIGALPAEEHMHPAQQLKAELDAAVKTAEGYKKAVGDVREKLARSEQSIENLDARVDEATKEAERRIEELAASLEGTDVKADDLEARIAALEASKTQREVLQGEERELIQTRDKEATAIAGAQATVIESEAEAKAQKRAVDDAAKQATEAAHAVRAIALDKRWDDVMAALDDGLEAAAPLRLRLQIAQRREGELQREIGAGETRIEQIEANIETARKLAGEEKEHREKASLAKDLASLLRADRFPTFIRERALQTLARDGSQRLQEISSGRYVFEVEGQDFLIVDQWNGGESRSVKTLSGGETFLASLALALALAEHLPGLATGGPENALESLFIDEGFSHLDVETLDIVASALEVLGQDRRRLIGVITHVPALADRMPARIVVHKSQAGSTVSVE